VLAFTKVDSIEFVAIGIQLIFEFAAEVKLAKFIFAKLLVSVELSANGALVVPEPIKSLVAVTNFKKCDSPYGDRLESEAFAAFAIPDSKMAKISSNANLTVVLLYAI
jgi:hypothetical protein